MEAVLTEKSVKLIAVMLSEPKIKAAVYEKLDHTEKYKIYTINDDGSITLGSTRFHFWNKIIGCEQTLPFESFALKVWDALVSLSTGLNQKAIMEGLSQEIVMKGVKDKNFNWVVERLYDVATKVCQNSSIADDVGADPAGSRVSGPRLNAQQEYPDKIVININGRKEILHVKDCIGKPMIELEYGIVNAKRVMP